MCVLFLCPSGASSDCTLYDYELYLYPIIDPEDYTCSEHGYCPGSMYCDTVPRCYDCDFCCNYVDAIDGQCPFNCLCPAGSPGAWIASPPPPPPPPQVYRLSDHAASLLSCGLVRLIAASQPDDDPRRMRVRRTQSSPPSNTAAIAGGVAGAVALLAAGIAAYFFTRGRSKELKSTENDLYAAPGGGPTAAPVAPQVRRRSLPSDHPSLAAGRALTQEVWGRRHPPHRRRPHRCLL